MIPIKKNRIQNWQIECDTVLQELDFLIDSMSPQMAGQLKSIISKSKGKYGASVSRVTIDFDKLVYYIDKVNDLDIPKNVIQKNPHFCETVLTTIADEYLKIKACLINEKNAKRAEMDAYNQALMDEYKAKVTQDWEHLCNHNIEHWTRWESEKIVREIRRSL